MAVNSIICTNKCYVVVCLYVVSRVSVCVCVRVFFKYGSVDMF